jgi:hypothetical protein
MSAQEAKRLGAFAPTPQRPPTAETREPAAPADDFVISSEGAAIPEGKYVIAMERWETKLMFGNSAKLVLWFKVLAGDHKGATVARYYNVKHLMPPMGEGGKFEACKGSSFLREFALISPGLSLAAIRAVPVWGQVRLVDKTKDGVQLNQTAHYSVVAKLLGPYIK